MDWICLIFFLNSYILQSVTNRVLPVCIIVLAAITHIATPVLSPPTNYIIVFSFILNLLMILCTLRRISNLSPSLRFSKFYIFNSFPKFYLATLSIFLSSLLCSSTFSLLFKYYLCYYLFDFSYFILGCLSGLYSSYYL